MSSSTVEAVGRQRVSDAGLRGIYPPLLADKGLATALEALQNVAKYAGASRATVSLRHVDSSLTFSVTDDGAGFDPGETGYGTGLQGIADRLGALDGDLEVSGRRGTGTTVVGRVPAEALVEPGAVGPAVRS